MKRFENDTLEQAVTLLLDKSEKQRPVKQVRKVNRNTAIVVIQVAFAAIILWTIWYFANHPSL